MEGEEGEEVEKGEGGGRGAKEEGGEEGSPCRARPPPSKRRAVSCRSICPDDLVQEWWNGEMVKLLTNGKSCMCNILLAFVWLYLG